MPLEDLRDSDQQDKKDKLNSHITALNYIMTITQVLGWPVAHQRTPIKPQKTAGLVKPN